MRLSRLSAAALLLREPQRFRFDAAVRVLARGGDPAERLRFRVPAGLAFPGAEVLDVEAGGVPRVTVGMMGLTGAAGVMPRLWTELAAASLRNRSRALADFLDLLSHRQVAMFARAGAKYRLHRSAESGEDRVAAALLALTGYGTPHLAPRLDAGVEPLLHYSGLFATRPRSAERLVALVSDWLGRKVELEQFAGAWLALPPDQRTALPRGRHPGQWCRLGVDATAGVRAWDPQARVVLRIGPLDRAGFEALLPDRPALRRLVSLVRAFVGFEIGFAVNPVLAGEEVPPLRLAAAADPAPRLGWNCWIPAPARPSHAPPRPDAAEAVFEAELVEAEAGKARAV